MNLRICYEEFFIISNCKGSIEVIDCCLSIFFSPQKYDIATKSLAKSNGSIEPLDLFEIEKDMDLASEWNSNCWADKRELNHWMYMRCAICYYLYNLKKGKNTHLGVLLLVKLATLLKVNLLRGCFSRFLKCTIGTKSRYALHESLDLTE